VAVRTNGGGAFTELTPRQPLTPTPYAIYAESVAASGISGTLTNGQLAHSAVTVNPGPGLSGGGRVALGNTIILTNTGVLSVTGNADITASTVGGAVTLGDTATSADTASTLVKRDGGGNFSTATITLDDNLNLPATTATAGIIYSGGLTLIHAYGSQNFFAGPGAGNLTMSGIQDTANGYQALPANTSGYDNTANGFQALYSNTSGYLNTADGAAALFFNTSGYQNTANGVQALADNTNGFDNTASGYQALFHNTSGSYNTANGSQALHSNTSGSQNTASGSGALQANTNGSYNTANGYAALQNNANGSYNTANGYEALYNNTSGTENTANGTVALFNNTSALIPPLQHSITPVFCSISSPGTPGTPPPLDNPFNWCETPPEMGLTARKGEIERYTGYSENEANAHQAPREGTWPARLQATDCRPGSPARRAFKKQRPPDPAVSNQAKSNLIKPNQGKKIIRNARPSTTLTAGGG
jgi:hypothetical protein